MSDLKTRSLVSAALFVCLTAIGAWIRIPFPGSLLPVLRCFPQCLGQNWCHCRRRLSQWNDGLPVFAGASGPHILFSPTFGYLAGFILASYAVGKVSKERTSLLGLLGSSVVGLLAIYACGTIGLFLNLNFIVGKDISFIGAVKIGVLPFLLADGLKAAAATIVAYRVVPQLSRIKAGAEAKGKA